MITLLQGVLEPKPDVKGEIDVNPTSFIEKIDTWLDGFVKILPNVLIAIGLFIAMFYIARWIGKTVREQLKKRNRSNFGEVLGSFTKWILIIFSFAVCVTIIAPSLSFGDLIGGLGVSSVAIGFAFQDILQNWLAGILILTRQPFRIGDEIEVNGMKGRVDRIETRATVITTYDGIDIVVPNNTIYTNAVKVITAHDYIRSQYDLGLGYDQPYDEAVKILRETLQSIDGIAQDKPIDILNWDQADSWLTIRMRWWTDSKRGNVVKTFSEVIAKTQHAMDDAGIDLPFPTMVEVKDAHDLKEAQSRADRKNADIIKDDEKRQGQNSKKKEQEDYTDKKADKVTTEQALDKEDREGDSKYTTE
ncbi:Mechanosensitive ion channel [Nonlabens sp. Hel1_33_55]|uniref:mechanosensitive ion channel family protein n=1 Tax=Nonlabens sp. Hel1_33_55 TaxID=1336802 RepID=UPI000875B17C|nr:mechanosensitive ion channel family protein [Nonlabens sp. Hel1_33_55]SCX89327.1 Mechanosensitive ion channel [Nonlabens sp. Hel1_33_55]